MRKGQRITMTRAQLASPLGRQLLDLLVRITDDGELSLGEIGELHTWLTANRQETDEIPAVAWLEDLVEAVREDGKVTPDERVEIIFAIERVLPFEERTTAQVKRQKASESVFPGTPPPSRVVSATSRQLNFIKRLGGDAHDGLSRDQASLMIDELLENRGPSPRQQMWLRFWAASLTGDGKVTLHDVSDFMEDFYAEDPDRRKAWELWKHENPEANRANDPSQVPHGAGQRFLNRVKGVRAGCAVVVGILASALSIAVLVLVVT